MVWNAGDPQGNEAAKVKYLIVPFTRGKGVDLGCGPRKAFPHFIGVDNGKDTTLFNTPMKPDVVVETCEKLPYADDELDFVFSSHLLEHIEDYRGALAEWRRVLKVGGHIVLYLPHRDLYPNIGQPGANPDHKHDFLPQDIEAALAGLGGWDIMRNETRDQGCEYSFLIVAKKRNDWKLNALYRSRRPEKTAAVVRYGGFGDMIQASGVLPELKRLGYHVTFITTPKGHDILKHDPHIDAFELQDHDQVPNPELGAFFKANAARFDRFINLCESVEVALLFPPSVTKHGWPQAARHAVANVNYGEMTALIAGVPYKSEAKFYPAPDETKRAEAATSGFTLLWVLAGSSVHKTYPFMDHVIERVMGELPKAKVIFVGDADCKILEQGWENNPRVLCASGQLGIRETMAVAQACRMVVGPETGVLNAVAFEPNAKVCLLSHSSHENLTKHWKNTTALTGIASCYPCHRLHHGNEFCAVDPMYGMASCQMSLDPDLIFDAIAGEYRAWALREAA